MTSPAPVKVFQLKCALGKLGIFFDAEAAIEVAPGAGDVVYEAWISGGVETRYSDKLSKAIARKIGESATRAAYEAAHASTLEDGPQ